jgi:hypothetical protein
MQGPVAAQARQGPRADLCIGNLRGRVAQVISRWAMRADVSQRVSPRLSSEIERLPTNFPYRTDAWPGSSTARAEHI